MKSSSTRRRVVLTGATGVMGSHALEQLLRSGTDLDLRVPVLPRDPGQSRLNRLRDLGPFVALEGDLTSADFVRECVRGADLVVHIAALVSPAADSQPARTMAVNVGSMRNLLAALKELGQLETTRLVGVGSIAETGSRMPPLHWGRVGDPLWTSAFDHYAVSKVQAERLLVESGVRRWAWLRQTAIASTALAMTGLDPIAFHQPLDNCLEWVTARDSGRLVRNLAVQDPPEAFWRRVYNIGGGEGLRLTGYQTMQTMMRAMSSGSPEELFEPWWFATQNFHGHWYTDADELEGFLHFRTESWEDFLRELEAAVPAAQKLLVPRIPSRLKRLGAQWLARQPRGTLHWLERNEREHLDAYYGGEAACRALPRRWDQWDLRGPSRTPTTPLSRGFDDGQAPETLDSAALREAARFRGGELLEDAPAEGDLYRARRWRCAFGHEFTGSLYLVLLAGHWCPHCEAPPWRTRELAARSPFLAQALAP